MTIASTEVAWAELPLVASAPYALLDVVRTAAGPIRAGVDAAGRRLLLVPASAVGGSLPGPFPVLHLERASITVDGDVGQALIVRCEDPAFWEEFVVLADEIVLRGGEAQDPAGAAIAVIERWRRLLSVVRRDRLGLAQRIGLFAELMLLKAMLSWQPGLRADIWTGPDMEAHDFELAAWAVEVKAVGVTSNVVHIHGLKQLEASPGRPLSLVVCTVMEDPGGVSIRDLVEDIEMFQGSATDVRQKAMGVGWTPVDLEQRFAVAEWLFMDVTEDTPRLIPDDLKRGSLRRGISRLSYDVDLGVIRAAARKADLAGFVAEVTA